MPLPPHIPHDPNAPPPVFSPPPPPRYFFAIVVVSFVTGVVASISYAAFGPTIISTFETRVERSSDTVKEGVVLRAQESVVQWRQGSADVFSFGTVLTSDGWVVAFGGRAASAKQVLARPAQLGAVIKTIHDPATGLTFLKTAVHPLRVLDSVSPDAMERGTRLLIVLPHTAIPVTLQDALLCVAEKCPSVLSDRLSHAVSFVAPPAAGTVDGAPVVTTSGELVGIAVTLYGRTVAVPFSALEPILEKLFLEERVVRTSLGVRATNTSASPAIVGSGVVARGFLIEPVGGVVPSQRSRYTVPELRVGDIIETWRGQSVESRTTLFELLARERAGARVPVTVRRDAKLIEIFLTVGVL